MKDIKDLKLKSKDAVSKLEGKSLTDELKQASKTLFTLRMKLRLGELKQTHLVKYLKRYIAQLNTLAHGKKQ
jgi:ribosomal protein L29